MTLNKWTKEIEDRFDLEAEGTKPTEKMENALDQLDELIAQGSSPEELRKFVRESITTWYKVGAKRGAAEMLKDLMWYDILPDDMDELRNTLEEPISKNDSLVWSSVLKYKKHDSERDKARTSVKLRYKKILKKLEKLR